MLKKQTVNEDKIQKSKVQAEQSKPQSKDRKMSRGEILKKVFGHLGKYRIFVVFSVAKRLLSRCLAVAKPLSSNIADLSAVLVLLYISVLLFNSVLLTSGRFPVRKIS